MHIDAFDDRELLEKDVSLRDRRLTEDSETAIADEKGLGAIGAMRGQVGAVDRTADRRDRRREALTEIAAIERVRAVAGDGRCCREVPLLEHLARTGPAPARTEDLCGLLVARDPVSPSAIALARTSLTGKPFSA